MENNNNPAQKISPREVFLQILMIGTLYFSVGSLLTLIFQYINIYIPDVLEQYAREGALSGIRSAVAMLTIIFPIFLGVSWMLNRDIVLDPAKLSGRFRKWLLYLTVFLAAIIIIGDLVSLIYNFLEGDLTWRFILKSLSVLLVASAVFGYYLFEIRRAAAVLPQKVRYFVWSVSVLVAVAVLGGFFTVGSPFEKRLTKLDERRISDLQNIQWSIINYYQKKEIVPEKLSDLRDDISGFIPPIDPENGSPYEYRATGKLSFELCANFVTENQNSAAIRNEMAPAKSYYPAGADGTMENWRHGAGRFCFQRTIDSQLYPVENKGR
ncbi:MAG: hypothetical protein HZA25_00635 [Candidatus Niyogibacteria bacterium]|nr:hypothetical protein [Candidatus Niyogibacteria bacterium]